MGAEFGKGRLAPAHLSFVHMMGHVVGQFRQHPVDIARVDSIKVAAQGLCGVSHGYLPFPAPNGLSAVR